MDSVLYFLYTAISKKVVGKNARDNPERYCGWFGDHCSSQKFQKNGTRGHGLCFRVLKGSSKSRFNSHSVRNSVLISHINFRDCRMHFYSDKIPVYITSEVKDYYEALFLSYRPQTKCSISQFFKTNCIQLLFMTIMQHVWAFSETSQKISKITYTASRFSILMSAKICSECLKRLHFNVMKNYCVYFLSNSFKMMCNLKKRLMRTAF